MRTLACIAGVALSFQLCAQHPELVVQSGHLSEINDLAFSPDGRMMATCGDDRTIKIWDLATEKLIRSITSNTDVSEVWFTPINKQTGTSSSIYTAGVEDSLYGCQQYLIRSGKPLFNSIEYGANVTGFAVAESREHIAFSIDGVIVLGDTTQDRNLRYISRPDLPDAQWAAIAFANTKKLLAAGTFGMSTNHILIWDFSGEPLALLDLPLNWDFTRLKFTGDDALLLFEASRNDTTIVGIFDLKLARTVHSWYGSDFAYSAVHDHVLFCDDNGVRVFDLDSMKFVQLWTFGYGRPEGLDVAPDGRSFAVTWGTEVYLDDYNTGEVLRELFGSRQYSSYTLFNPQGDKLIFNSIGGYLNIWNGRTGRFERLLEHHDYITRLAMDTAGKYLATAGYDSVLILWDLEQDTVIWKRHLRTKAINSLTMHPLGLMTMVVTATDMTFFDNNGNELEEYRMELSQPDLYAWFGPKGNILMATPDSVLWSASNSDGTTIAERFKAYYVELDPNEEYLAAGGDSDTLKVWSTRTGELSKVFIQRGRKVNQIAFTRNGKLMAAGYDNGNIVIWDFVSDTLKQVFNTGQNQINGLSFSRDGRFIVTSSLDGDIQLIDARTYRKVASLYTFTDGSWAVIDSAGRYDASDGTNIPHLHYRVDLDTVPYTYEFIELKQLASRYWDPDLLQEHLGFTQQPLKDVGSLYNIPMYPKVDLTGSTDSLLMIGLTNRGGGIGEVMIMINGKEVEHDLVADTDTPQQQLQFNLYLHPALRADTVNVVSVSAYNREGSLLSAADTAHVAPTMLSKSRPRLFAIVVGVSDYQGDKIDLQFAARDAETFARTLRLGAEKYVGLDQTHLIELTTSSDASRWPTRKNIELAFERVQHQATSKDLLVIFFSGHGVQFGDDWYFLTSDAMSLDLKDEASRQAQVISGTDLYSWIKRIPRSNQALILDACASGKLAEDMSTAKSAVSDAQRMALESLMNHQSMYVLAGSAAQGESLEAKIFGQGLLTYTLLESLKNREGMRNISADVGRMFDYADRRVPFYAGLIDEEQDPVFRIPAGGEPFVLGIFTDSMLQAIPLPEQRPFFSRSFIDDRDLKTDRLKLSARVDDFLQRATAGPDGIPAVMLVKDKDLPDSYRVRGEYSEKNGVLTLEVWLFLGDVEVENFRLKGSDADQLAREVAKKVLGILESQNQQ